MNEYVWNFNRLFQRPCSLRPPRHRTGITGPRCLSAFV